MPRHVRSDTTTAERMDELVLELARELNRPKSFGQPIILEDQTPKTNTVRTQVVWDRWDECPEHLRTDAILEAYESAFGTDFRRKITLALGVTLPEAIAIGLLPYQVLYRTKGMKKENEKAYRAMREFGATTLEDSERPMLRFATLDAADVAVELLEKKIPGSKWTIKEIAPS